MHGRIFNKLLNASRACIDVLIKWLFLNYLNIFLVNAKGQRNLEIVTIVLINF